MRLIIFLVAMLFIIGCNNKTTEVELIDSTDYVNEIITEDSSVLLTKGVQDWVGSILKKPVSPAITFEEFWKDETLIETPFTAENDFYKNYSSLLRWSPDSNYILDIGTYGTVLTTDAYGNPGIESGEPDSELALIEPGKNTRTRLMFVGPSSEILDAKWVDNKKAIVVGTFDTTGNKTYDTLVWVINVKDKIFRLYNVKIHR